MTLPTIAGVQSRIHTIADRPPFMIIREMAEVFGLETASLALQFKRKKDRFPEGYFFVLTPEEYRAKSRQIVETSRGNRADLEQFAFPEKGALFLLRFVTGEQADTASVMLIEAFAALREHRAGALRHEVCIDKWAYVGRSTLRQRIMAAADAGASYNDLWGRWGYSHRVLTGEIEAMRVRGYIGPMVLTPPLYVLREIEAKKAHTAVHVDDTTQLRLGLEG